MTDIKAIPTHWRGWHFRSRTEARWAVFFTHLEIDFRYEPEGFILGNGNRYLPDFYLPQVNMFAEVKPDAPTENESLRAALLADSTGANVLFLDGSPAFKAYTAATRDCGEYTTCEYSLDIDFHHRHFYFKEHRFFSEPTSFTELEFTKRYREAVYASRAERFETRQ